MHFGFYFLLFVFFLSVFSNVLLNVYSCVYTANLFPFIRRIYFRLFAEFISVYSPNLFPFIRRIYFRLFAEFISVYSPNLFPFFRSVFCRSNAVESAVRERCSYMHAHVRTRGKRRIMKLGTSFSPFLIAYKIHSRSSFLNYEIFWTKNIFFQKNTF
jgi:hypothetical protein